MNFPIKPLLRALVAAVISTTLHAELTLEDRGEEAVLGNGIITATVSKSRGALFSLKFAGEEFVKEGKGQAYYSFDGGKNYTSPWGCEFRVHSRSETHIDVVSTRKWKDSPQAVDMDIHYVITEGLSGLYSYAVLRHRESYPATSFDEWRMVWKLPSDLLDTIAVDEARHWEMPSAADYDTGEKTPIKEITKMTAGVRAGKYDCKYDFNANYYDTPSWGHYDKDTGLGAWMVFGAHEWFNDGPTKQDLTAAAGILHVHFGMNHYSSNTETKLDAGEKWQKVYGPSLLYVNRFPENPVEAVADARAQAEKEAEKWPYDWVENVPAYPGKEGRGSVSGKLVIRDSAKPMLDAGGAWIGLAQPDEGGNWQFESKRYQYWARVAVDGAFKIPHVRPGEYTLYCFQDGVVEEFAKTGVKVQAGKDTGLGALGWEVPRDRGELVWEIGAPDRTAAEFRHGDDYFQGFLWKNFGKEWPNPLVYEIGKSIPGKDWNYAHSNYPADNGEVHKWRWEIRFKLDEAPAGDATLTIALASAESARLSVAANGTDVASFLPEAQGGNALMREGIHAKYSYRRIPVPAGVLNAGDNVIRLTQEKTQAAMQHVMYDYLSLEVPKAAASE